MPTIAIVTTDGPGRLSAESTLTVDGRTIPIPERVPNPIDPRAMTPLGPLRIVVALAELGYVPVEGWRQGALRGDTAMALLVNPR